MRCTRLKPWFLVAGLAACAPQQDRAPQATGSSSSGATTTTGATGGVGGTGGATGGASGTGGSLGGAGGNGGQTTGDAAVDSGPLDAGPDTPLVIIHRDANPGGGPACANDLTAVGSNRLLASGTTPPDFAAAYNAELLASSTAGPLLFAFYGVNDTNLLGWIASVGALAPSDGGGVGFAGGHADVPFTLSLDRSLHIAAIAADFELELGIATSKLTLPLGSIALDGALSIGCGALTVEKATLLVPVGAGTSIFHGSTVEALMGPPTETLRGVAHSAWPLELSGTASQVYAPGLLGDGGIEP
jgi:hypothetical protein